MDLTSLSSTLPRSNPPTTDDPEEPSSSMLLAAFKQTALSVTTLYKTAANETERSRREGRVEGYQDCLDDLLAFVEKVEGRSDTKTLEMLRQWALSKRRRAGGGGGSTPKPRRREDREESAELDPEDLITAMEEPPVPQPPTPQPAPSTAPAMKSPPRQQHPPVFSFRSNVPAPLKFDSTYEDVDIGGTDMYSPPTSPAHNIFQTRTVSTPANNPPSLRLGSPSSTGRHTQQRTGSKRRIGSLGDFFDIAGVEKMQLEQKRRRHQ